MRRAHNLTTICLHVPIVLKSGNFNLLEPSGPVQACNGIGLPLLPLRSRGSSVIIVTRLSSERSGFRISISVRVFCPPQKVQKFSVPNQPPIRRISETFPRVTRPEHDCKHIPPSSADVKNEWSYTSTVGVGLQGDDKDNPNFHTVHSPTDAHLLKL